jgi:error-prone DNA polymerase
VLVRQRPGTAKGVIFITIEDETGVSNLVVFKDVFETFRREILSAKLLMVEGKLERQGAVIHIVARKFHDLSRWMRDLAEPEDAGLPLLQPAKAEKEVFPPARNFK